MIGYLIKRIILGLAKLLLGRGKQLKKILSTIAQSIKLTVPLNLCTVYNRSTFTIVVWYLTFRHTVFMCTYITTTICSVMVISS